MTTPKRESGWGITPATTPAPTDTGVIVHPPSRWPTKPPPVRVRWWRWQWTAVDEASGEVLASGHAPTERWAWTRADAAAKRIHDERLEASDGA